MWSHEQPDAGLSAPTLFHRLIHGSSSDGITADLPYHPVNDEELQALMTAWSRERSQLIEAKFVLGRLATFLAGLLEEEGLSAATLKRTRRMLQAIELLSRQP